MGCILVTVLYQILIESFIVINGARLKLAFICSLHHKNKIWKLMNGKGDLARTKKCRKYYEPRGHLTTIKIFHRKAFEKLLFVVLWWPFKFNYNINN